MIVEYICGVSLHEIMMMTTLNFIISLVTLTIVLLKRPVHVIEDRNLSDLR
jgi:hypothetical protein